MQSPNMDDFQTHFMTHLIDASAMRTDLDNVKAQQAVNNNQVIAMLGRLTEKVEALQGALNAVPERITACRNDMRREIEKDFPNRVDAIAMETRIEEQVRTTDTKLSRQIASVENNVNGRMDKIERKIDTLLVKIGVGLFVSTVMFTAFWWIIENISPAILK
jgi:hypothetical protein